MNKAQCLLMISILFAIIHGAANGELNNHHVQQIDKLSNDVDRKSDHKIKSETIKPAFREVFAKLEAWGMPLDFTDDAMTSVAGMVLDLKTLWTVSKESLPESSFYETVKYMTYCFLSPSAQSAESEARLRRQQDEILEMLKNSYAEFYKIENLSTELLDYERHAFSLGRQDLIRFMKNPFYRFAQLPLDDAKFLKLKAELASRFNEISSSMVRAIIDARDLSTMGSNTPGITEIRVRPLLSAAALFLNSAAALRIMVAYMAKNDDLKTWFPFGKYKSYGIRYPDDLLGKGIIFYVEPPKEESK